MTLAFLQLVHAFGVTDSGAVRFLPMLSLPILVLGGAELLLDGTELPVSRRLFTGVPLELLVAPEGSSVDRYEGTSETMAMGDMRRSENKF